MIDWHSATEDEKQAEYARLVGMSVEEWRDPVVDDPPPETDLALLVRLANARLERTICQVAKDLGYDLGAAAVHTMRALGRSGKPIAAIAERLLVTSQAAGQVVARLVDLGLAERRERSSGTLVMCTADGRVFVREVDAALVDRAQNWSAFRPAGFLEHAMPVLQTLASDPRAQWR